MVGVYGVPWLSGLPKETLAKICEAFCPHCAGEDCLGRPATDFGGPEYFGTLDALTKVNVGIGRQAQLVRHHFFSGGCHSLPKFVRTLAEQPVLAAHVRVVRLGDDSDQACVLEGLDGQGVEEFWAAVMPEFCAVPAPSVSGSVVASGASAKPIWEREPGAKARFNAFALFALAKNIESVAVLGEWACAVFSNLTESAAIVYKFPNHTSTVRFRSNDLWRADFANLAALDIRSSTIAWASIKDLIKLFPLARLREFRFVNESDARTDVASDLTGCVVVKKLIEARLADRLTRLEIDTSENQIFGHWGFFRRQYYTVGSLGEFSNLRDLSISADCIYFPSMYRRVLLRNRGDEDKRSAELHTRLVNLLPAGLHTLEITGIYAIPIEDVKTLARNCMDQQDRFGSLRKVVLKEGGVAGEDGDVPYPFPRDNNDDMDVDDDDDNEDNEYPYNDFEELAEDAEVLGDLANHDVARLFAAAGVEYKFDHPEFFFGRFAANWDE